MCFENVIKTKILPSYKYILSSQTLKSDCGAASALLPTHALKSPGEIVNSLVLTLPRASLISSQNGMEILKLFFMR